MDYNEAINYFLSLQENIGKSIVPMYFWDEERKRPQLFGSSVYLNLGLYGTLFTAFHVIKEVYPKKLMSLIDKNIIGELPCEGFHRHNREELDIGIVELKEELRMWKQFDAVNWGQFKESGPYQHFLLGYPASSAKKSNRSRQVVKLEGYLTDAADESNYKRLKKEKSDFALINFKKERVYNETHTVVNFPDPNGMSGGIVLQIPERNPQEVRIVGIINELDMTKKNIIIATRIERYFDVVKYTKRLWIAKSPFLVRTINQR